ncbi:MAG: hypothetical protein JNK14_01905 [Chitinophagaceae bacterium]|nr:hypothetical protein [Chitinophagaceae bacterium]
MFGLFSKKNSNECPIDPEMRLWMENSFLWLTTQFGHDNVATKPMLHPSPEHFPIRYDGSIESLTKTAEIVARQMEIDINEIKLDTYEQNIQEFSNEFGHRIWTEVDKDSDEKIAAGLYFDKDEHGRYDIFIEKRNLTDPENLVATLAHEFSHIKILGEKRLDFNDEQLTDLTPVVFGLGIFNANSAFKESKSFDSYGHNSIGYLKQKEWGYALALYAYFRQEENSGWIKYLTPNIQSDFKKSMDFINANKDKVFIEEYKGSI